ncbi:hypothetical protein [Sporomusa ovata]|uniref:CheW-like domain-containing protein n=2 Tax=Sporomusa ovata TaxID=2378 RepID=A0A0U1KTG8_9FIRM|nr:hypothetical protein [Sporomusa ovata]CQR70728.1 hypothetical protein SpAn4DRAFT_1706 [Sporomusa ovata]
MYQNELQLLIISLGDRRYGIDIDQIAYLTNFDPTESAVGFDQLLTATSFANCHYSKMLLIKQKLQTPILINEPDEVATCKVSDIRKLPDILTVAAGNKGVWGLLPQENNLIILIDFYKNHLFIQLTRHIDKQIYSAVTRSEYK